LQDKEQLLDAVQEVITPKKRLDFKYLLITYMVMAFVIALAFFKIYINQQIYYESRKIAKLRSQRALLMAENRVIRSRVEAMRFKNQIADTLFDEE